MRVGSQRRRSESHQAAIRLGQSDLGEDLAGIDAERAAELSGRVARHLDRAIAAWRECPVERRAQVVISKTAEQMLQQSAAGDHESLLHLVDCRQFLSNMFA